MHQPLDCLCESMEQEELGFLSIFDDGDGNNEIWLQVLMSGPIAYSASLDPDTKYMNQAIKQPGHTILLSWNSG
jgi:hypothetical protein